MHSIVCISWILSSWMYIYTHWQETSTETGESPVWKVKINLKSIAIGGSKHFLSILGSRFETISGSQDEKYFTFRQQTKCFINLMDFAFPKIFTTKIKKTHGFRLIKLEFIYKIRCLNSNLRETNTLSTQINFTCSSFSDRCRWYLHWHKPLLELANYLTRSVRLSARE